MFAGGLSGGGIVPPSPNGVVHRHPTDLDLLPNPCKRRTIIMFHSDTKTLQSTKSVC